MNRALLVACLLLSGCASIPRTDITSDLIARPDFKPAAQASPTWVGAALQAITRLEAALNKKK